MPHQIRKAMSSETNRTLFTEILVVGIVDRDNKKVYAEVALPNKNNQKLTGKQLLTILEKVAENNTVMTDEFKGYNILDKDLRCFRQIINHKFEFSRDGVHTNSIESFWAVLKRGIHGIYHHVPVKYLQRYIDEFTFRYNFRNKDAFEILLGRCF